MYFRASATASTTGAGVAGVGLTGASRAGGLGFGAAAAGVSSEAVTPSFVSSSEGLAADSSAEFAVSFVPPAGAAVSAGALTVGVVAAFGGGGTFADGAAVDVGVLAAGWVDVSGAGCDAVCPEPVAAGADGLVAAAGGFEFVSVVPGVCSAADGLFERVPSHPKP